jgi:hypothetical protein
MIKKFGININGDVQSVNDIKKSKSKLELNFYIYIYIYKKTASIIVKKRKVENELYIKMF